jgi:hypothetical protein
MDLIFRCLSKELFATRIGGFFGLDVIVSAVVLLFFIHYEGRSLFWPAVVSLSS